MSRPLGQQTLGKPALEERRSPTRRGLARAAPRRVGDRRSSEAGLPNTPLGQEVIGRSPLALRLLGSPKALGAGSPS
jgi:hypothetical protein